MKTPFAPSAKRSSLLVALAAVALVGCGGKSQDNGAATAAPTVKTQPKDVTAIVGGSVTFRVEVSGRNLSYQWYRGSAPISGATSATYTINPVSAADFGTYYVRISNDAGEIASGFATLKVPSNGAPTITDQPVSATAISGGSATFRVQASGDGTLTYQWFRNSAEISGATSSTLTVNPVNSSNVGTYFVRITNDKGTVDSNSVSLTIAAPAAPTITTQPSSKTVTSGSTTTFTVVARGTPAPTYQWLKDGVEIPGETSSVLRVTSVSASDVGSYTVRVSNSQGTVTSQPATLAIATAPQITLQPQSQTVNQGQTVTLSADATGTAPLTYTWYKGSADNTPVATGPTYTFTATANSAGQYHVVVSNTYGSDRSADVTVTVIGPPVISQTPANVTVGVGTAATFTVTATDPAGGTLTYQWYKNGAPISNATGASYTTPVTTLNDNGATYRVRVTSSSGLFTDSANATLTVRAAPVITDQPDSLTVTAGSSVAFNVTATGEALTYKWYKNGVLIPGAESASYTIAAAAESDEARYTVKVTSDGVITTTSNEAILTVN